MSEALNNACLLVEGSARENCPSDDGTLRNSITSQVDSSGEFATVGTNVEYAPYVHQGTGIYATDGNGRQGGWNYCDAKGNWHFTLGQKPNPFLFKALEDNKEKIYKIFQKEVEEKLK